MKPSLPQSLTESANLSRRRALLGVGGALGAAGLALWPEAHLLAQQANDFIVGPAVEDIPAKQLSKRVWMVYAKDSFPTPENRGMMANSFLW